MARYIMRNFWRRGDGRSEGGYTPVIATPTQFKVLMYCGEWLPLQRHRTRQARVHDVASVRVQGVRIRSIAEVRRRLSAFADAKVIDSKDLI